MKHIKSGNKTFGEITVPGDKSISHRAVMFASLARGTSKITGLLNSFDVNATRAMFSRLGACFQQNKDGLYITGTSLKPQGKFDCGNSGTTARLSMGILAGVEGACYQLDGDEYLRKRDMKRVREPLQLMGAHLSGDFLPLTLRGGKLQGIEYQPPVASAQVKSCILLAGLQAEGETIVNEIAVTRNHTEIMLKALGADIEYSPKRASIKRSILRANEIIVPGDISSAAFFIALALITKGTLVIKNVGLNETRRGVIDVFRRMGAHIEIENIQNNVELYGDIVIKESGTLKGVEVKGEEIANVIDELPIIAAVCAFAQGESVIRDASELRKKESDRIQAMCQMLNAFQIETEERQDGMRINGGTPLGGCQVKSFADHRIAMSAAVMGAAAGGCEIDDFDCVAVSYPEFYQTLEKFL